MDKLAQYEVGARESSSTIAKLCHYSIFYKKSTKQKDKKWTKSKNCKQKSKLKEYAMDNITIIQNGISNTQPSNEVITLQKGERITIKGKFSTASQFYHRSRFWTFVFY